MKKKLLSLALTALAVISLAACGAKETVSSTAPASTSVSSASEASTPEVSSVSETSAEQEPEPVVAEKYFSVQDIFTITLDEVQYTVVTGYSVGGTIYTDDTLVLETAGERIETKVVSFETMQGEHPTCASENENIAVWLDKYLSKTIQAGDKLVDVTEEK